MLIDLHLEQETTSEVMVVNQTTITISKNPIFHWKTKHFNIKLFLERCRVLKVLQDLKINCQISSPMLLEEACLSYWETNLDSPITNTRRNVECVYKQLPISFFFVGCLTRSLGAFILLSCYLLACMSKICI